VRQAIQTYLTHHKRPEFLVFASKGKLTNLYNHFIQRYAAGFGYGLVSMHQLPERVLDNIIDSIGTDTLTVLKDRRSPEQIDEIQSIGTSDVLVGFDRGAFTPQELGPTFTRLNKKIAYTITKHGDLISMYYAFEPNRYENFAFLATIPDSSSVIPKARRVEMAAVHPQFQRQGWGTKLYDIFFDKVGGYLLADYKQSPGAKKIWADMAENPKLEVVGLLGIDSDNFNTDPSSYYGVSDREHDALWKKLMDIGARHVRQKGQRDWFIVPVRNLGKRLEILQHFRVYNQVDFYSAGNEIEVELLAYPKDATLEEGWRETLAGAAAAATLGYGAVSQMDQPQTPAPLAQPAQTRTAAARPDADAAIQAQVPQAHRDLVQQARAAGIRGQELAHFVAQMAHETGNWQHMEEQPPRGAKNPQRYFARKYEGKKILGNSHRGDGYRFRGRGYVQLTGRDNYSRAGRALGIDLVNDPDQAADPATAAQIAVWYWKNRVAPRVQDFTQASVPQVTRQINPGQRGAQQRQAQYQRLAQR
jgi:predicted chitinase